MLVFGNCQVENTKRKTKRFQSFVRLVYAHWTPAEGYYFPMQKVPKIKLRMSSVVVAPVISSSGRRAA